MSINNIKVAELLKSLSSDKIDLFNAKTLFVKGFDISFTGDSAELDAENIDSLLQSKLNGKLNPEDLQQAKIDKAFYIGEVDLENTDGYEGSGNFYTINSTNGEINLLDKNLHVFYLQLTDKQINNRIYLRRNIITQLTRVLSNILNNAPLLLLTGYSVLDDDSNKVSMLTLSMSELHTYKRGHKDNEYKLGRIIMLKDININNPNRGHISILDDLRLSKSKKEIKSINYLFNYWLKEVLSVQALNDKFYGALHAWFESVSNGKQILCKKINNNNHESNLSESDIKKEYIVKFLTRIIFVWFLREMGIINKKIFEIKNNKINYYDNVLSTLFFETLNNDKKDRKYNNDIDQELINLLKDVPYLNGGLFDKSNDNRELTISNEVINDLFKNLNDYKFTVAENTPLEIDVALDPELLGKVFENLLNYVNPLSGSSDDDDKKKKTKQESTRKITGSYYTNNDLVMYMVNHSLVELFISKLSGLNYKDNSYEPSEDKNNNKGNDAKERYYVDSVAKFLDVKDATEKINRKLELSTLLWQLVEFNHNELQFKLTDDDNTNNGNSDNNDTHKSYSVDEIFAKLFDETLGIGSGKDIYNKLNAILSDLKVLDPACGSGAFPMGILHSLNNIWSNIDPICENIAKSKIEFYENLHNNPNADINANEKAIAEIKRKQKNQEYDYLRKLEIIKNNICGTDIQPIALHIAKLRFFIALTIGQKIDKNRDNSGLEPLPNLETKLLITNSLLTPNIDDIGLSLIRKQLKELSDIAKIYFVASNKEKKAELKEKYYRVVNKIIDITPTTGAKIAEYNPFNTDKYTNWFDMTIMFNISRENDGGFDIVIGNPPYVRHKYIENNKVSKSELKEIYQNIFAGAADLYVYFFAMAYRDLCDNGTLSFVTSNKWLKAGYGKNLRKFVRDKSQVLSLIDLSRSHDMTATVDVSVLISSKEVQNTIEQHNDKKRNEADKLKEYKFFGAEHKHPKKHDDLKNCLQKYSVNLITDSSISLSNSMKQRIKEKAERIGNPLSWWETQGLININYGIVTGFNKAFIIDEETKNNIIKQAKENNEKGIQDKSKDIIKPVLRGKDIKRWQANFANKYIITIFPVMKLNIDEYQAIKNHLHQYYERLQPTGKPGKRKKTNNKWFETQDTIAYYKDFEKEKIIYPEITKGMPFIYDINKYYINNKCFIITGEHLYYLLGILNSSLFKAIFKNYFPNLRDSSTELRKAIFINVPIPMVNENDKDRMKLVNAITTTVDKIIALSKDMPIIDKKKDKKPTKKSKVNAVENMLNGNSDDNNVEIDATQQKANEIAQQIKQHENELDKLVAKLYGLTDDELDYIMNKVNSTDTTETDTDADADAEQDTDTEQDADN